MSVAHLMLDLLLVRLCCRRLPAPWCRPAPAQLSWHASPAASVTSRGTPLMSSFAASIGLDCPVEIVNLQELQARGLQCACAFVHATKASV